jgi:crotonobetainyl-CoA:carnitine CoA-transferase CaiB-like acyl-CoA transferase
MTATDVSLPTGPLRGVRIVELSSVLMLPYAGQLLGDLGAEIIKVETVDGDPGRAVGTQLRPGLSGMALNLHRNKRSVAVDLKRPEGRQVLDRLVADAAVFMTNFRPRALRSLRATYEDLSSGRQDLVYCEAHGYRRDDPEADEPAYDDVLQAAAGLAGLSARVGSAPSLLPTVIIDKVCGLTITYAVLAALFHRAVTGQGQRVEVPMFETALGFTLVEHLSAATSLPPLGPPGYDRVLTPHRRPYRTADGWVAILPYLPKNWIDLWTALGRQDLVVGLQALTAAEVMGRAPMMYEELGQLTSGRTTAEWLQFCRDNQIAAAEVRSLEELVEDPACHRGTLVEAAHPDAGPYRRIVPAVQLSATPAGVHREAPSIGQHTAEVLGEIGYTASQIADLASADVVHIPDARQP